MLYSTSTKIFVQTIAEHEDETKKSLIKRPSKSSYNIKKDTEKEDNVEITVDYQEDIHNRREEIVLTELVYD